MAKRKTSRRGAGAGSSAKRKAAKHSVKRQTKTKPAKRAAVKRGAVKRTAAKRTAPKRAGATRKAARPAARARTPKPAPRAVGKRAPAARARKAAAPGSDKRPRLDRQRRTLEETVPGPPSSLDMDRHGSSVRTGRAEMAQHLAEHGTLTPDITAGDVDVNVEDAYFTGDEAPGGDNSTPDQDVVDEIGKALGVEYEDGESLKSTDKVGERDKHRWELDPASSEDYKDRK